jgi:hypothetical protein
VKTFHAEVGNSLMLPVLCFSPIGVLQPGD